MDTHDRDDRLTLLERAQLLHDATLRRHGELLEHHEERMARLEGLMEQQLRTQAVLGEIAERLVQRQDQHAEWLKQQHDQHAERLDRHEEIMLRITQTLDAIRDLLDRGNGR